ncbi:2-hydroxychromene-2-carboxylate isomerase [Oceanibacterium hippocampi]|uniref:2-hydroxychromene-2-carboxylate isomerase n=1 Tax=Oceanibacterium hippocampi TaxID=745714 RepID=A0A1Y5TZV9_9PROT|nr:2-hydroxychromene-2-carboxylate isomerase [Oceanibacterium hippocampi]SLN77718.1 2-hydroxychromene-2-carboxylate isomerase [Oceanibacterium hippocampi]
MSKTIEFYYDVGSPAAYLAWTQIRRLAEETGATVDFRPMLLGGVFKAVGNTSPADIPAKGRYFFRDMKRYASRYGVPFRFNPHFPINTLNLMRGAILAGKRGESDAYLDAVYPAIWRDEKNMNDPAVIGEVLTAAGLDAKAYFEGIADPEIKGGLIACTEKAVERGIFGAPTFFIGDEMFFGQDRLDWVREAAAA